VTEAPPPQAAITSSDAKHDGKRRIFTSVYVPCRRGYKSQVDLAAALREAVPGLSTSSRETDRAGVARDAWQRQLIAEAAGPQPRELPALVVWPEQAEQLEALVAFARREGFELVPYGAGSGVCGAIRPRDRCIAVDTKRLTRVVVDRAGGVVDVAAGVLGVDLEAALSRQGLTVGHFPSSILCSTVGGWLAARGAGQCSSRYGKVEDLTESAEVVLGSGISGRFSRRPNGPNPLDLLIGSEGTLGVITSTRLRLRRAPAERVFAAYRLPSFEEGADAMRAIMQAGLRPAVMRLYDPLDSYLLSRGKVEGERRRQAKSSGMPSGAVLRTMLAHPRVLSGAIHGFERFVSHFATLILVFEGERGEATAEHAAAAHLLSDRAELDLGEGPAREWLAHRYAVSYRQSNVFQQGAFNDTLEIAAPWARLADIYAAVRASASEHALVLAHLSHAYPDGCSIYFTLVASRSGNALGRYDALLDSVLVPAIEHGATLSHHHGVGASKAHLLDAELGGGIETLRQVRRAWDPDRVFNPGAFEALRPAPELKLTETVPGIDAVSGIASYRAQTPLSEIERDAGRHGLTLGLVGEIPSLSLGEFIAAGLPGVPDPRADPVRGGVCGIAARTRFGGFRYLPAPRRAVGPQLTALCIGASDSIARVESASLCLVRRDARTRDASAAPPAPLSEAERRAWSALIETFRNGE